MIYFKDQYATVWEVEDKGNYSLVKMSTSRKDKKTDAYVNSNWSFVRFVKDAHESVKDMGKQTRIVIDAGAFSNEPYINDEGVKTWPKNPQLVAFHISLPEDKEKEEKISPKKSGGFDTPPVVEPEDEELPF